MIIIIILMCIVGVIVLAFVGWYIVVKLVLVYGDKNKIKLLEKMGYHKNDYGDFVNDDTGDVLTHTDFDTMFEIDLVEYFKEKESHQKSKKR